MKLNNILFWTKKEDSIEADNKRRKELAEWLAKQDFSDEVWARNAVESLNEDWTAEQRAEAARGYKREFEAHSIECGV